MARRNTRRSRVIHHPSRVEGPEHFRATQRLMEEIHRQCRMMPPQALTFILKSCHSPITIHQLARFWSNPTMCEYTRGEMARAAAGASWFSAMWYLTHGKVSEAEALALNGCFLYQCLYTRIETMMEMRGEDFSNPLWGKSSLLKRGFDAIQTPEVLKRFLQSGLPYEYREAMSCFNGLASTDEKMGYVGSISDAWKSSSVSNHQEPLSGVGARTQLILVDDANDGRSHSFNVGPSTTLKVVLKDYAEKRRVSLRSLRFSHRGKTLFLSSIGNKTPNELNLGDRGVINVIDTSVPAQESSSDSSNHMKKKSKFKNRPKLKGRGKSKVPTSQEEPAETLEEARAQHSMMLTKLHEELQPRLRDIRNRLNAIGLDCQPPKLKRMKKRKKKNTEGAHNYILPNSGTGGKAGKPYFVIQVGEVENLYKTKKLCHPGQPGTSAVLDLHRYSKSQALNTLNEKLPEWVNTAMNGEYPWVMTVQIICGCGSQVLSEAIQEWIKSTRNVSNAPKNGIR